MGRSTGRWAQGAAVLGIGIAIGAGLALRLRSAEPRVAEPAREPQEIAAEAVPEPPEPKTLRGELAELKQRVEQQTREIERLRAEAEREASEARASAAAEPGGPLAGGSAAAPKPAANLSSPVVRRPDPRLRPNPPEPPSVRAGLTEREVSAIAGAPVVQRDHGSDGIEWVYECQGGGSFSVFFEPDSHTVDRTHSYGGCQVRPDGR